MNAKVSKWGNSLALRIPKGLALTLRLKDRAAVDVKVEDGALVVRPVTRRKRYDLDRLLDGITTGNRHGEVTTGASVGNEY